MMKTHEEDHGVVEEPQDTCPLIDQAIRRAEDDLDDIRKENEALREWGEAWRDVALRLHDELAGRADRTARLVAAATEAVRFLRAAGSRCDCGPPMCLDCEEESEAAEELERAMEVTE